MPVILQINVSSNWGSTGRIAEQIGLLAIEQGWDSYIAYGRYSNPSKSKTIRIGSQLDVYKHYIENKLFDKEGLASVKPTRQLIAEIKKIRPDVIHLHNIHDHFLNYEILFGFLNTLDIPIVWTQHDCWAFTGGCGYFSMIGCDKWKTECQNCVQRRSVFFDRSQQQFRKKKELFTKNKNLILVPVSEWLAEETSNSFLGGVPIHTILNGVDTNTFRITKNVGVRDKYNLGKGPLLLAVASYWPSRKGLPDYIKLSTLLKSDQTIVLVGLNKKQMKNLPHNIVGIPRTQNVEDLVELYNEASIVLNLSYEETFGLTTVEGFACGTPGIVYNCTASPELITPETGRVVEGGDIEGVNRAIQELIAIGKKKMSSACRQRAVEKYDKKKCYGEYITLYNSLVYNKLTGGGYSMDNNM